MDVLVLSASPNKDGLTAACASSEESDEGEIDGKKRQA